MSDYVLRNDVRLPLLKLGEISPNRLHVFIRTLEVGGLIIITILLIALAREPIWVYYATSVSLLVGAAYLFQDLLRSLRTRFTDTEIIQEDFFGTKEVMWGAVDLMRWSKANLIIGAGKVSISLNLDMVETGEGVRRELLLVAYRKPIRRTRTPRWSLLTWGIIVLLEATVLVLSGEKPWRTEGLLAFLVGSWGMGTLLRSFYRTIRIS